VFKLPHCENLLGAHMHSLLHKAL